jgi:ABC-type lipoprotein export system ATPase subunit
MSFLKVENVTKVYGQLKALNGLNLNFEKGKQYAIVGASGSGKSTLLYLMGGLDQPSQGDICIEGRSLKEMSDKELAQYRNEMVGFVFQFHFLLPSMNCMNNILLPSRIGMRRPEKLETNIKQLANYLGVEHCLKKFPYELSGGEQQRINIIRALSLQPKLLLCDEPTGNLDSENSKRVTQLLKELAKQFAATLIVVTHDNSVASQLGQRITLKDGQLVRDQSAAPPPPPMSS